MFVLSYPHHKRYRYHRKRARHCKECHKRAAADRIGTQDTDDEQDMISDEWDQRKEARAKDQGLCVLREGDTKQHQCRSGIATVAA